MILDAILNINFSVISFIINLLPSIDLLKNVSIGDDIIKFIHGGLYFSGNDWIIISISLFTTFYGISLTWAIIEWVYKKLPGVD